MSTKTKDAAHRIAARNFSIPSPDEVTAAQSGYEAWTALQLAEWGIEWPPPAGWRNYLNTLFHWYGSRFTHHDTVFDRMFQAVWMRIRSEDEIPLINPSQEPPGQPQPVWPAQPCATPR